jgi:tetratricopeptide (TPR) repeat protein
MKYTWLVEKYLEGELSGEALRKFELEILRKQEVAEELERVRSMHHFMREQHAKFQDSIGLIEDYEDSENVIDEEIIRQDLDGLKVRKISAEKKDVIDFSRKYTESKVKHTLVDLQSRKVLVRKVSVWLAAASVAILLATSFLLLIGNNASADYMALYEQHFAVPYADIDNRDISSSISTPYLKALKEYNDARYGDAYKLFEEIPEESVHYPAYFLYKGITAMELRDFQAAIESFDKLMTDPMRKHSAMWYTGLSYLAMHDLEAARKIFREIINTDGHYKKQARSLLRSI